MDLFHNAKSLKSANLTLCNKVIGNTTTYNAGPTNLNTYIPYQFGWNGLIHFGEINNLNANTKYYYIVGTNNISEQSDIKYFKTKPKKRDYCTYRGTTRNDFFVTPGRRRRR